MRKKQDLFKRIAKNFSRIIHVHKEDKKLVWPLKEVNIELSNANKNSYFSDFIN